MDNDILSSVAGSLQAIPGFVDIINIVVLLAAVFFFSSTLASHILEYIVGLVNSRGRLLYDKLSGALGATAAEELYGNPLIKSLQGKEGQRKLYYPSYIEPEIFARAVISQVTANMPPPPAAAPPAGGVAVNTTELAKAPLVQLLLTEAGGDAAALQAKLAEWYKAFTERQTGAYTRWSFMRLFLIGLALAATMDIDVFHLTSTAWRDHAATARLVDQIEEHFKPLSDKPFDQLSDAERKQLYDATAAAVTALQGERAAQPMFAWQGSPADTGDKALKLVGWLLAAFGISLGAQFWFNILSETLKLRAAGKKPDDPSTGESGKDNGQNP